MRLTAHLGKITWSLADKGLYVLYGFVQLLQIKALPAEVYGVFALLVGLNTWIMIVSDGSALQGVIQFGTKESERGRVNVLGVTIHTIISMGAAAVVFLFREPLATVVDERFVDVAMLLPLYALLTLPRMFCLKLIYREMRTQDLFWVDMIWFGVRTGMTVYMLSNNSLNTLEDIVLIDFVGMGASSLAAVLFSWRFLEFRWKGSITTKDYLRFGVPLALATALNSTPRQLDVMVIAAFFGVGVVGVYNPAKNLFRFFEQAFDAVVTLLYPAAVRMHSQHRIEDMQILVTKAISFTLIPTIVAIIVLELGASNVIVWLLGEQYADAVTHFNILIIGAIGMPFGLMASVIAAMGQSTTVVRYSAIGLLFSFATLFAVSYAGWAWAVGFGMVMNTIVVGILCTNHIRRSIHFPLKALFRSVEDVRNAIAGRSISK
jgi:O-antigen/teichoic acid export membrane protein